MTPLCLTVGYVPGVTPAKWARTWAERHPEVPLQLHAVAAADAADALRAGAVDVALLRPPADTSGLAVIPLYEETTVAVVPTDHILSCRRHGHRRGPRRRADPDPTRRRRRLGGHPRNPCRSPARNTKDATELVAAGIGVLIVPQSLARLHHRKDITYRPIPDAPTCPVALAVPEGPQRPWSRSSSE